MCHCMSYTDVTSTSMYTSVTHSLQVVGTYVCMHIYVYMHAYVYGCVCASMILFDVLRRRY